MKHAEVNWTKGCPCVDVLTRNQQMIHFKSSAVRRTTWTEKSVAAVEQADDRILPG